MAKERLRAEKRDKQDTLQQFRTLQNDPRSLGLTDSERERDASIAKRIGGPEAEAKSYAQSLDLSGQLQQRRGEEIRNRMSRRADIARDKKKTTAKTLANVGLMVGGAVTAQPGLVVAGAKGLAKNPSSEGVKGAAGEDSGGGLVGKYLQGRTDKRVEKIAGGLNFKSSGGY